MNPIGIYLHIPYCNRRCTYCSFVLTVDKAKTISGRFLPALVRQIGDFNAGDYSAASIYFGGGTPSLLEPADLEKIFNALARFPREKKCEVTLEANPESVTPERAAAWRELGVNRVSLGAQSFDPKELTFLGRWHAPAAIFQAYDTLREAGFKNLSVDLIFGLPGSTGAAVKKNVEKVLSLAPEHVSLYGLTIDGGTHLKTLLEKKKIAELAPERYNAQYLMIDERLTEAGFEHYEVSNFAQPGFQSRNNSNYWRGGEYAAFGPGAHGYLKGHRFSHTENIGEYIEKASAGSDTVTFSETIEGETRRREWVMLGLRTREGLSRKEAKTLFPFDFWSPNETYFKTLVQTGYARLDKGRLILTAKGFVVSDEIIAKIKTAP